MLFRVAAFEVRQYVVEVRTNDPHLFFMQIDAHKLLDVDIRKSTQGR
jgi:hypothetical protein